MLVGCREYSSTRVLLE